MVLQPEWRGIMGYNPKQLKRNYEVTAHGSKARMEAIRYAIQQADYNNDEPFRIFFREELCYESDFFGNSMDMMIIFPEILSIIDQYPHTPVTRYDTAYKDAMGHVMWIYKWVLSNCSDFYQVPLKDCKAFYRDYKKRCIKYGHNLRSYYELLYYFYDSMGDALAAANAFQRYRQTQRDSNSNCKACEHNFEADYYINIKDDFERAKELLKDIEDGTLVCGSDNSAWIEAKSKCMFYYLSKHDFENADKVARLIEHYSGPGRYCNDWDGIMNCYGHKRPGRGLSIYKKHWKEWQGEHNPGTLYLVSKNVCCFFKGLLRINETVKLDLDQSFPFYSGDMVYNVEELYNYYYNQAKDLAVKFDKRNGTDAYMDQLEEDIQIASIPEWLK